MRKIKWRKDKRRYAGDKRDEGSKGRWGDKSVSEKVYFKDHLKEYTFLCSLPYLQEFSNLGRIGSIRRRNGRKDSKQYYTSRYTHKTHSIVLIHTHVIDERSGNWRGFLYPSLCGGECLDPSKCLQRHWWSTLLLSAIFGASLLIPLLTHHLIFHRCSQRFVDWVVYGCS